MTTATAKEKAAAKKAALKKTTAPETAPAAEAKPRAASKRKRVPDEPAASAAKDLPWDGAPSAEIEKNLAGMHAEAQRAASESAAPASLDDAVAAAYEPPTPEDEEEAVSEDPRSLLSKAVERASRFVVNGVVRVLCYRDCVVGMSPVGVVIAPWNAPSIPEGACYGVEGRHLLSALRASHEDAEIQARADGGITVSSKSGRFHLPALAASGSDVFPPYPDPADYVDFDPATFRIAASFTADDKLDTAKPHTRGVHLGDRIEATNLFGVLFSGLAPSPPIGLSVHRAAFDGLGRVRVARKDGYVHIVDVDTGERRAIRAFADSFPDVGKILATLRADFAVSVDAAEFRKALRHARIVQKRTVPVRLWLSEANGGFIEIRAGRDPTKRSDAREFVHRMPARIASYDPTRPAPTAAGGVIKLAYELDAIEKIAAVADGGHFYFAPHDGNSDARRFYYLGGATPNVCIAWTLPMLGDV